MSIHVEIILPALLAGFLILISHVPLGRVVLERGIIFVDLAIAQVASLGLLIASMFGFEAHGWELQIIALGSALFGAMVLGVSENFLKGHQEAFIGIVFVLAASLGILLLAHNPHGGEHLRELLVGQILWVEWQQLLVPAVLSLVFVLLFVFRRQWLAGRAFYFIFAIFITQSVQLVGVYLVFASLIIPALAFYRFDPRQAYVYALLLGVIAYGLGLLLSTWFDLPSGALIVWVMAVLALCAYVLLTRQPIDGKSSKSA